MATKAKQKEKSEIRPPVVVVLGHIDHGKTKLLDFIRKTKVAEGESGGITQHIGAYEIDYREKKITFIDTPGHEAFSHIRSRGAKAADIAVLVVAADEGVKPQTKEAIMHAKSANLPIVVAINKTDKPNANPEKVKGELKKEGVVVESLGGDAPSVNISAKEGTGVDELLEMIQLVGDLQELKTDSSKHAEGVVLESHLDAQQGSTATLLVLDGSLRVGDWISLGNNFGKLKSIKDFLGKPLREALPSQPAVVTGMEEVVEVGDTFQAVDSEEEAANLAKSHKAVPPPLLRSEEAAEDASQEKRIFFFIIKADVLGSLEAVEGTLGAIVSPDVELKIIKSDTGDVNENDVKLASSAKAHIFGFRVSCGKLLIDLAKRYGVKVFLSEIIYELVEQVKKEASKLIPPEKKRKDVGSMRILAIFGRKEKGRVIGGKVVSGKIKKGATGDVVREGEILCTGRVIQLQRNKKDADEVAKGDECGILFNGECEAKEGDELHVYEIEEERRTL